MKQLTRTIDVRIITTRAMSDDEQPKTKDEIKRCVENEIAKRLYVNDVIVTDITDHYRAPGEHHETTM